jgi:hypothetical protein
LSRKDCRVSHSTDSSKSARVCVCESSQGWETKEDFLNSKKKKNKQQKQDHFPPSRLAGVMSLNATAALYAVQEIAKKIIPALSHMCIDVDARVREEAFKAIKHFIGVLENQYLEMSDDQFTKFRRFLVFVFASV